MKLLERPDGATMSARTVRRASMALAGIAAAAPAALPAVENSMCDGRPVCFQPMTEDEIKRLPPGVAPAFRQIERYQRLAPNVDVWQAMGSNCASFALNAWGEMSFSGDYSRDTTELNARLKLDEQTKIPFLQLLYLPDALKPQAYPCDTLAQMLLHNKRLNAYMSTGGRCDRGGYMVVPFIAAKNHLGITTEIETHVVRQMPNGQFAHVQGPDAVISWIRHRNPAGVYEPATLIAHLVPFERFELCPAVCVRPDQPPVEDKLITVKPPVATAPIAVDKLQGDWVAVRPDKANPAKWSRDLACGPFNQWVRLTVGLTAGWYGNLIPGAPTGRFAASLITTSNVTDVAQGATYSGVNLTFAGHVAQESGTVLDFRSFFDATGRAGQGETDRSGRLRPPVVDARAGVRIHVLGASGDEMQARIAWQGLCGSEVTFKRAGRPLSR